MHEKMPNIMNSQENGNKTKELQPHTLILTPKILKDQLYQALAMLYKN